MSYKEARLITKGSVVLVLLGCLFCMDAEQDLQALKHCFIRREKLISQGILKSKAAKYHRPDGKWSSMPAWGSMDIRYQWKVTETSKHSQEPYQQLKYFPLKRWPLPLSLWKHQENLFKTWNVFLTILTINATI